MAKNVYGPQMAKNVYGPQMAKKNLLMALPWPKMLKVPLLSILKFLKKGDNNNKSKT